MDIHLLDMGRTKYGDCLLITHDDRTILIDGAHPGDSDSVTEQLEKLLNKEAPFNIDLLIVTHCHNDHIGCLPKLIKMGVIQPQFALVADEKLGFGRTNDGDSPMDNGLSNSKKALLSALLEEDHSDLSDEDIETFLDAAMKLEDTYIEMLEILKDAGTKIVRYGRNNTKLIEDEFSDFGLKIIGPTKAHLALCAENIERAITDYADLIPEDFSVDNSKAMASVYRRLVTEIATDSAADMPGVGAAKNNQSIVISVEADGWRALLTGDMQLAKAEVSGLNGEMQMLIDKINESEYDFIKFPHHCSYNGIDEDLFSDWLPITKLYAHSGGWNDPKHPEEDVLALLEGFEDQLSFARTDRNGIISVVRKNGKVQMRPSKGSLNDFTINSALDEEAEQGIVKTKPVVEVTQATASSQNVEVLVRLPNEPMKVTVTVEISGAKKKILTEPKGSKTVENILMEDQSIIRIGASRSLPRLLFVTSSEKLSQNVSRQTVDNILKAIRSNGKLSLVDLPSSINSVDEAAAIVRTQVRKTNVKGVVIVGGYDVVPSNQTDALDKRTRDEIERKNYNGRDIDDFIIWSDDLYVDMDEDGYLPELPISRIPDGRQDSVLLAAIQATAGKNGSRFGVRNHKRPFAVETFDTISGNNQLLVSEKFTPADFRPGYGVGSVYYMLHGSYSDTTRFWGETDEDEDAMYEAVSIDKVPRSAPGTIVFTGCCWGALSAYPPAFRVNNRTQIRPFSAESSIAIAYLKAGCLAFVGCTGSHYSPTVKPYDFYGKPMHDSFWKNVRAGKSPAEALFLAKIEYAENLPHSRKDIFSTAIEMKILKQFTCLGLGW